MFSSKNILVALLFLANGLIVIKADGDPSKTGTIKVTNDTDKSLNLELTVPEQTVATIQLKRLEHLHAAILSNSADKIKQAVFAGANINQEKDGKSPLLWAILLKRYNAVETLLQLGANANNACWKQAINLCDMRSLLLLIPHNKSNFDLKEIVEVILSSTDKLSAGFSVALIIELANLGHDVNELWKPAIHVILFDQLRGEEIVRFLINRGANPNYKDIKGVTSWIETPLLMATGRPYGNKQLFKILMEAGADINKQIEYRAFTVHHRNVYPGSYPRTLLASVISKQSSGMQGWQEVLELLLEHGASL